MSPAFGQLSNGTLSCFPHHPRNVLNFWIARQTEICSNKVSLSGNPLLFCAAVVLNNVREAAELQFIGTRREGRQKAEKKEEKVKRIRQGRKEEKEKSSTSSKMPLPSSAH